MDYRWEDMGDEELLDQYFWVSVTAGEARFACKMDIFESQKSLAAEACAEILRRIGPDEMTRKFTLGLMSMP